MLVLEIAAGIILAVVILKYWRFLIKLSLWAVAVCVAISILAILALLFWMYPKLLWFGAIPIAMWPVHHFEPHIQAWEKRQLSRLRELFSRSLS